jgi:hypothetical protein
MQYDMQTQALHLIVGALLVMEARPHLVTESQFINRVRHKPEAPKEFWTPRVLGEYYKMHHESVDHGGHHNGPRLHWVVGHWRDLPHGPGRELRRMTWIDPHTRGED